MGIASLLGAAVNCVVATTAGVDLWLLYATFGDFLLFSGLFVAVLNYARC